MIKQLPIPATNNFQTFVQKINLNFNSLNFSFWNKNILKMEKKLFSQVKGPF